jgi:hypothetical protein
VRRESQLYVCFGLLAGIDDLHRLLTEERIGQGPPLEVIRRTERLTLQIVPEEVPDKKR